MNEHTQKLGVRKWAGDDLVELQKEGLDALQALVEPYAPCIIQGCEVRRNGEENTYTVSPGFVALRGNLAKESEVDEERQGVKIVRFEGMGKATLPLYLGLGCETENRPYLNGVNKPVKYRYVAEKLLEQSPDCLTLTGDNAAPRLVDTLGITQKLDRVGGDASQTKVYFSEANAEELKSGNPLSKLFGAIKKWLDGIKGKLDGIEAGAKVNVQADWGNDDNTSDAYIKNKPGNATTSTSGLMSSEDKIKLNGIADRAKVNVQSDWSVTDTDSDAFIKNKPTSLPADGGTANTIKETLPFAKGGTGETTAAAAAGALLNGLSPGTAAPADNANIVISGNGTTTFYKKPLSYLWNWIKSKLATVATSGSYNDLSNKPTIGNGTITIKQAGTTKGSFTVNQSGSTTIELTDNNTVYSHPNTLSAQTGAGPSSDSTLSVGSVFKVPALTANTNGHIIDLRARNLTLPGNATTSSAGFMSAADKKQLTDFQIVGIYFTDTGRIAYGFKSERLKCNQSTHGNEKCLRITMPAETGTYMILPLAPQSRYYLTTYLNRWSAGEEAVVFHRAPNGDAGYFGFGVGFILVKTTLTLTA